MNSILPPKQKNLEILFYLMIAFALIGPTLGIPVTHGFKLTFFRVVFFTLVIGILIQLVSRKKLEAPHMVHVRWYVSFFFFWLVYALISLIWVIDLAMGLRYIFFLLMMLPLCLSIPYFTKTEKHLWKILTVIFGVICVMVYFGFFESITFFHLPSSRYWLRKSANVTSFFQNQNDFATTIVMAFPFLATALYSIKTSRKVKIAIYITIILSLYCLFATASRSNTFFAMPLIIVTWLIVLNKTVEKEKLNRTNIIKGLGVVLSIVLMVSLLTTTLLAENGQTRAKLASTLGIFLDLKGGTFNINELDASVDNGEGTGGQSIIVRKYLLLYGLDFLEKSHFIGVGAGNVEAHMKNKLGKGINKVNIHNWWAEVLVNFGVIVFAIYMFLYFWLLRKLWILSNLKRSPLVSPLVRWVALASFLSLIGFFFGGIAPSTCIHFTPMWAVLGIAMAAVAVGEQQKTVAKLNGSCD